MNEKTFLEFIDRIEQITGLECFDSEFEGELDEYEIFFGDQKELGLIITEENPEKFSIFSTFVYNDYKQSDVEKQMYDSEELEFENRTYLEESLFRIRLEKCNYPYALTLTDDGNYMCPGFESWVGFFNIPYSEKIIINFAAFLNEFYGMIYEFDDIELKKQIALSVCKDNNIILDISNEFTKLSNSYLEFDSTKSSFSESIEEKYFGNEYFLFKVKEQIYYSEVKPINLFIEIYEKCSLYDKLEYLYEENKLFLKFGTMILSQSALPDNGTISNVEEINLLSKVLPFVPFGTPKFKNTFFQNYSQMINISGSEALIITEGTTDWMHLKKHWEFLKYNYKDLNFSFLEYYPFEKCYQNNMQQTMGGTVLLEMCKAFSKLEQSRKLIFIADCDEEKVKKELSVPNEPYKKWGNNVYSMILPVPKHRASNGEICIEHLYTDDEIKQSFACTDNIERHLYLGKDFDTYGRCINEDRICIKRNICGPNSIKVIDGSSDCKVVSFNSNDTKNYALTKMDFAKNVNPTPQSESFEAFENVFRIIADIIVERNQ